MERPHNMFWGVSAFEKKKVPPILRHPKVRGWEEKVAALNKVFSYSLSLTHSISLSHSLTLCLSPCLERRGRGGGRSTGACLSFCSRPLFMKSQEPVRGVVHPYVTPPRAPPPPPGPVRASRSCPTTMCGASGCLGLANDVAGGRGLSWCPARPSVGKGFPPPPLSPFF